MIEQLKIKEAIKRHGLTVNEVADIMEITRFTLSTHINGNPSTEVLLRIADAIGCDITELFESPKKNGAQIICPNCGKQISIKAE